MVLSVLSHDPHTHSDHRLPPAPSGSQDYIPELVALSKTNLDKDDDTLLTSERVLLKVSVTRQTRLPAAEGRGRERESRP